MPTQMHHMLTDSAARRATAEALVDDGQSLTYEAMAARCSSLAAALQQRGVKRGERVAIFLPPTATLPLAIFGVSQSGAVFVPVHHGLFPDQVAHILRDSGATALITDQSRWLKLQPILSQTPDLALALVDGLDAAETSITSEDLALHLATNDRPQSTDGNASELAAILYTSGSTGKPKGVMLSHENLISGAEIVSEYLGLTSADRILAALPLSFDAGLNQLTTAVLQGGTTAMIEFRFGRQIAARLAEHRITGLAGVPSLWSLLAQPSSGLAKQPLPALRYITNTGGVMPQNVLQQLRTLLPQTDVVLMYGLTEAFRSTYLPPSELDRRPTSMGRAIPRTEILVVDEAGNRCGPDQVGELVHHGPTVSLGYWNQPELTDRALRPHPLPQNETDRAARVCYSGDLVMQDADGFLYFVGRRDNQIKSAGFRISPTEVEEVICQVARVRQAAVVGVPDPVLGQHLVAFALLQESTTDEDSKGNTANESGPDSQTLQNHCAATLPRHMVPKQIRIVDTLPMTASGKVDYPKLRAMLADESEADA